MGTVTAALLDTCRPGVGSPVVGPLALFDWWGWGLSPFGLGLTYGIGHGDCLSSIIAGPGADPFQAQVWFTIHEK